MAKMIELGIPEDQPAVLQALGRLAVAHGNLEMVQIMCVKTLESLRPDAALETFRRKGLGKIRERIEEVVAKTASTSEEKRMNATTELLRDAHCHSKRRNAQIHRFWGKSADGTWTTSGDESVWEPVPSIDVIDDLIRSIVHTTRCLNKERQEGGFIHEMADRARKAARS